MRRLVQLFAVLVAVPVLGVGAAAAGAATTATDPAVPLAATVAACKPAKDATGGTAIFVGSMPQIPGATRMEMRFELLQATGTTDATTATGFASLPVPKWSAWLTSQPDRAGFVYRKKIVGLVGPGVYRAQVVFRWRDAAGKIVRKAKRRTPGCAQPDLRANLVPVSVTAEASGPDTAEYRLVVRNAGRTAAPAFSVGVSTPGAEPAIETVDGLAPKGRTVVLLSGPRCVAGTTVELAVDTAGVVDEADETDNVVTVACPLLLRR